MCVGTSGTGCYPDHKANQILTDALAAAASDVAIRGLAAHTHPTARRTSLPRADMIEVEGVVSEALPNAMFGITLQNDHRILATLGGKLRVHYIKVLPGDRVKVELSPYDLTRGRITYRMK